MKSLVVEDDQQIVRLVQDYLERAEFSVDSAANGDDALARIRTDPPDIVVLDLGLPGRDGIDTLRQLRRIAQIPVVIVTARGEEADRITGLELGADDYLVKPFSPRELVARVRAVLRRIERPVVEADRICVRDLMMDIPRMRVEMSGRPIDLTPTEFQLLVTLARQPGRVYTRNQLLDAAHGFAFESYARTIDAHIKNLRRKIEIQPAYPEYIVTVYGVGYRFADG